jgi:hypothetical protein
MKIDEDYIVKKLKSFPKNDISFVKLSIDYDSDVEKILSNLSNKKIIRLNKTPNKRYIMKLDLFYDVIQFKSFNDWAKQKEKETKKKELKLEKEYNLLESTLSSNKTSRITSIVSVFVALAALVVSISKCTS